jgi:peptidyl-tRNA hydrolase
MEDHNTPEAIETRASQEDPIVMYLIVRESLSMGMGKTAAQCAHAAQMLQLQHDELDRKIEKFFLFYSNLSEEYKMDLANKNTIFKAWLAGSFRKVVLRAKDKEWEKLKQLPNRVVVVDAGLTEIAAGSETVIGLWPMYRSHAPKLVQRLQVLK